MEGLMVPTRWIVAGLLLAAMFLGLIAYLGTLPSRNEVNMSTLSWCIEKTGDPIGCRVAVYGEDD